MGRKRGLPRSAREKVVAEEAAEAMDQGIREEVVKKKPNEALFVLDSRGSGRKRAKIVKETTDKKYFSKNEKKIITHKYLGKKDEETLESLATTRRLWMYNGGAVSTIAMKKTQLPPFLKARLLMQGQPSAAY